MNEVDWQLPIETDDGIPAEAGVIGGVRVVLPRGGHPWRVDDAGRMLDSAGVPLASAEAGTGFRVRNVAASA